MLRGTNSKDKLNGSIGITKKLLESDAYAMIATHDIKLAEMGNDENLNPHYAIKAWLSRYSYSFDLVEISRVGMFIADKEVIKN